MENETEIDNVYMVMPLARVRVDAKAGVSLARRALAVRDPAAAQLLGLGIEPDHQKQDRMKTRSNNERESAKHS
jgi:hypothetical protein